MILSDTPIGKVEEIRPMVSPEIDSIIKLLYLGYYCDEGGQWYYPCSKSPLEVEDDVR